MRATIAVVGKKGGSAKTTTAFNLVGARASSPFALPPVRSVHCPVMGDIDYLSAAFSVGVPERRLHHAGVS